MAVRILIGGTFLYAASISIRLPEDFADSIAGYQLLPVLAINPVALTLPALEITIGALLIVGWPRRVATFSALILTIVFAMALGSALARGLTIDCGCFGHGTPSRIKMWLSLGRDLLLGTLLIARYRCESRTAQFPGELAIDFRSRTRNYPTKDK
jgi:hypothetical protein